MQVAGQDQWGNITAGIGIDPAKKMVKRHMVLQCHYWLKSDGTKFGKTNGKAIWLMERKHHHMKCINFY